MTEEKKTNEGVSKARRPYHRAFKKNAEQKQNQNQEVVVDVNIEKKPNSRVQRKTTSRTTDVKRENNSIISWKITVHITRKR